MAVRRRLSQSDPLHNDQPAGDAHEPDGPVDTSSKPTKFERPSAPPPVAGPDPFDPASLRLEPDLAIAGAVKKVLLTLRVGKPEPSSWVRVHPSESYRLPAAVLEIAGEGKMGVEVYAIPKALQGELATEPCFRPCVLALAVTRQGDPFLWRVNLPRDGEQSNTWAETARDAIDRATRRWVRIAANMRAKCYDVWEATGPLPEPTWPELSFPELLKLAFKDRLVSDLNHPVLRRLRGEV
jgi:hypothetical protein